MLSGFSGVTINGADLAQFHAKLLTKYEISAGAINPTIFRGRNRASISRLGFDTELLTFDFSVDIETETKAETVECYTALTAALNGARYAKNTDRLIPLSYDQEGFVDIDISDGYIYHVTCSNVAAPEWASDEICTASYTMTGQRRKKLVTGSRASNCAFEIDGTFPKIDCFISVLLDSDYVATIAAASDRWIRVTIYQAGRVQSNNDTVSALTKFSRSYWSACFKIVKGTVSQYTVQFDGIEKVLKIYEQSEDVVEERTPAPNEIQWDDFPYFEPAPGAAILLEVSSGEDAESWSRITSDAHTIYYEFYPVFL